MSLKQIGLAAVLFIVALIAEHTTIPGMEAYMPLARILLFLASYLMCGLSVVKTAVWNLLHGNVFDEKFLMAVASIGAVCIGEYPEAVAVMLFYQIGEYFQDYAVDKSHRSITALLELRPDKAFVKRNSSIIEVSPESVSVGEVIIVKPGERIPLDGTVISGNSFVDTSAQTGESVPREIFPGTEVLAGFVNTQGVIEIQVSKPFSESSVARIFKLIKHATQNKARSERFITRFSRIYTPIVCFAALLVAFIPPLVTKTPFQGWLYRALIFLVVSCPCALVISVPLSFFGGIGSASRKGILIKGSNYMEALASIQTAVFDKTGTLTKGNFIVSTIHTVDDSITEEELLAIATHAELYSTHPISKSLKMAHHCPLCDTIQVTDAQEISGQGIIVTIDGKRIIAGNLSLIKNQHVTGYIPCDKDDTGTVVHVAIDGSYAGHIVISDELKEDAINTIAQLKKLGITKTVMLTGDTDNTAQNTAKTLGIDTVFSQLLPEQKVSQLEALIAQKQNAKESVVYIGDGINDAPVLARSDVGIAMNALGSDAAIEAADIVLMTNEVHKLVDAIKIARKTVHIAYQNIIFALGVKVLIMILGTLGIANMWIAVFGDVGVAFLAILNAMRLLF
ncbi:MAG: cadmium-translocating P-type ATPase [Treponema sp.]|nr:cadmium-translocating P-type ATPase [Treponema sp.]